MMQRPKSEAGEFLVVFAIFAVTGVSGNAGQTLLDVREDVCSRNANTRVWVYEYGLSDPLNSEEVIPITRRVLEKGTGINYVSGYDEEMRPIWRRTETNFARTGKGTWRVETGPAKVNVAPGRGRGEWIRYEYSGATLEIGVPQLVLYEADGRRYWPVQTASVFPVSCSGNRMLVKNAFTDMGVELVYEPGAFHVNLVMKESAELPSAQSRGLDPDETWIGIAFPRFTSPPITRSPRETAW